MTLTPSRRRSSSGGVLKIAGMGFGAFMVLYALITLLTGWCFQYAINAWMEYAGKPASEFLSYWTCYLLALIPFVGQLSVPGAVITFVVLLFL